MDSINKCIINIIVISKVANIRDALKVAHISLNLIKLAY
jgi:hypothetical protein